MHRAYSLVTVKDFDPVKRTFAGIATSPVADRVGDVIDQDGIEYKNPLPLLLYHNSQKPVGEAAFGRNGKDGTPFDARISTLDRDSGIVKERLDEAVDSLAAKPPLIRGVSIGFRPLEAPTYIKETGGYRFSRIEVLELSMVVIPAHQDATIATVKSLDAAHLAAPGKGDSPSHTSPRIGGTPVVKALPARSERSMKSITEQLHTFQSTRDQKFQDMNALMTKSGEAGTTLEAADAEKYDSLKAEVKSLDEHIARCKEMEAFNKAAAVPVDGGSPAAAAASRAAAPVISVADNLPPGIGLARFAIAQINARKNGCTVLEFAKARWADDSRLHAYVQKASVPAGTTTNATWAGNLVDPTNLASEFLEYLRPRTIVGRIPGLRRVPFNVRVTGQSTGAVANWVGQGKAKPVTSFGTSATTLLYTKIAAIAVITEELARFSSPAAEALVRDELARAVIERMDIDFIDPAQAAVANVSPASITNGVTALTSAGTSADNARTDLTNLLSTFVENNLDPTNLVLIMPNSLALALSLMVNSLGQPSFTGITPQGGTLLGIPVVASQYAANASGAGNLVIALDASSIFLADDGNVTLDASREASIEMSDAPLADSTVPTAGSVSVVSMYQTNSIAIRAERFINWAKARTTAVQYLDDVNWGSVGSPA